MTAISAPFALFHSDTLTYAPGTYWSMWDALEAKAALSSQDVKIVEVCGGCDCCQ